MTEHAPDKPKKKNDSTNKMLYGIIGALIIGIIAVSLYLVFARLTAPDENALSAIGSVEFEDFDGATPINPPREMPDFTLINQDGEAINLSDLRGKYVLLTFGYTHCPDVCPLTLNEFRRIRESLGDLAENVEFVFISVDGERDTPDVIQQYFETRDLDGFIGLSGEADSLRKLGVDYGLYFEIGEGQSQGGYLVDHTAGSYLLDRENRWIMRYQFGTRPSLITEQIEGFIQAES